MFGKSPDQKYQHYLNWFAEFVKDESNWAVMRADRDCSNWQTKDAEGNPIDPGRPIPFERGEALFKMSDPKKMAKALSKKVESNHKKYSEMSKYINGDPDQGLINPEYQKNMKALKETQNEISRSYSVYTELTPKQLNKMSDHNRQNQQPKEEWRPMTAWEALKHFVAGNKVESTEVEHDSWRDQLPKDKK